MNCTGEGNIIHLSFMNDFRGYILTPLRALRHRNYRLFFIGQGISLVGTWMQSIAMNWLVYRLTASTFTLGVVGFAGQIPAFLFSPVAGVMSDRWRKHRVLLVTQALSMFQAGMIAALTIAGSISVWQIMGLTVFLGLVNSFDLPTRQAFVIEMVDDRADLSNAIALNSALFNSSRLLGPALAGMIVAFAGEGVCFVINTVSYAAVIASLLAMRTEDCRASNSNRKIMTELREGMRYVRHFQPIKDLLITLFSVCLIGMSFPVLMPEFATEVLKGTSHTYGFLISFSGIGAFIATMFLAMRKSVVGLERIIQHNIFIFGIALTALSLTNNAFAAMALLLIAGFGLIVTIASSNTILQTIVDDDKRGRVMSFYVMAVTGSAPLGSLMAGAVSSAIGTQLTLMIGGALIVATGIVFSAVMKERIRESVRPIYRSKGIIPEVASGLATASVLREPPE